MPTIPLHLPNRAPNTTHLDNPLPPLLQTPSGLALLEIQGTIHFPAPQTTTTSTSESHPNPSTPSSTQIGTFAFPLHNPALHGKDDTKWMKRVYLYVGKNQRMSGEARKLVKPFAVLRKRVFGDGDVRMGEDEVEAEEGGEELEIVEVVRYKVVFSSRPEPVSEEGVGEEG